MLDILKEVLSYIPNKEYISECSFEGANIVLYTKNKEFLFNNNGMIKEIVDVVKKRIELRPDPSITMDPEDAKKIIEKIIPKEAGIDNVIFDYQRSRVIIEAEKPGLAIGKSGDTLKEIKKETFWVPLVRRTPPLRSKLIENIRQVLYENNDFRKKFLNKVGERIYGGLRRGRKEPWVRISFLGGAREVGRSCLLLQTQESRVLLDCGINAAAIDESAYPYFEAPEFNIKDLDAVVLSHPHLDHSAALPLLIKYGYDGPIYCTSPTRDIVALLTLDLISIMQKEAKKVLYSSTEVKEMVKRTICLDYEEVSDITPDIRLTFYNSGHALGAAQVHLNIGNGFHNLLYTADLNYETSNLLSAAATKFPRCETLIIEGTYGGKDDLTPTRRESELELYNIIKKTIEKKGKVMMPVLGIGRSQEVMVILEKGMREGLLEKIPIYVQGMVWDVTAIHTAYPDFFNAKVRKSIFHNNQNPFMSDIFKRVGSQKEMEEVINEAGPCVIMATSGMMVGGPIVEYFKKLADNPNNVLVFTSYQGDGSLGRRILNGEKEIAFQDGSKQFIIPVKCGVYNLRGFSGHSSRDQLIKYVYNMEPRPKKVIVNHGEASKCLDLASSLHKLFKVETLAPKVLDSVRLR
ncbi:beta-CASP ribonuclease aCPSF1 [Candidatus Woesearchaeota archaeon]|nr:beta-CASP ribonuclease aCPSF1 [Candidatus Woesearchaeota archaeon]